MAAASIAVPVAFLANILSREQLESSISMVNLLTHIFTTMDQNVNKTTTAYRSAEAEKRRARDGIVGPLCEYYSTILLVQFTVCNGVLILKLISLCDFQSKTTDFRGPIHQTSGCPD